MIEPNADAKAIHDMIRAQYAYDRAVNWYNRHRESQPEKHDAMLININDKATEYRNAIRAVVAS